MEFGTLSRCGVLLLARFLYIGYMSLGQSMSIMVFVGFFFCL